MARCTNVKSFGLQTPIDAGDVAMRVMEEIVGTKK